MFTPSISKEWYIIVGSLLFALYALKGLSILMVKSEEPYYESMEMREDMIQRKYNNGVEMFGEKRYLEMLTEESKAKREKTVDIRF